jgi:hypothetical protein
MLCCLEQIWSSTRVCVIKYLMLDMTHLNEPGGLLDLLLLQLGRRQAFVVMNIKFACPSGPNRGGPTFLGAPSNTS